LAISCLFHSGSGALPAADAAELKALTFLPVSKKNEKTHLYSYIGYGI